MTRARASLYAPVGQADVPEGTQGNIERAHRRFAHRLALPSEADRQEGGTAAFKAGVLLGQDIEQKRVAEELHDDVGQRLTLAALELNEVEQLIRTAVSPKIKRRVRAVRQRLESVARDIHRISHTLHPTSLVHLGLVSALRGLCRDFSERTHIDVEFTSGNAVPLQNDATIALYRVTQECLTNVLKHSGSARARVTLTERSGVLHLTIADRGGGFDVNELPSTTGLGLVSMRERAHRMGGDVQITSAPGRGATVTVRVPLDVATGRETTASPSAARPAAGPLSPGPGNAHRR